MARGRELGLLPSVIAAEEGQRQNGIGCRRRRRRAGERISARRLVRD